VGLRNRAGKQTKAGANQFCKESDIDESPNSSPAASVLGESQWFEAPQIVTSAPQPEEQLIVSGMFAYLLGICERVELEASRA
jgi:hypothetical protein